MACHLRYALMVLMVVVVIIGLSRWTGKTPITVRPDVKQVVSTAMADNYAARSKSNRIEALLDVTAALATLQTATYLSGQAAVDHAAGGSIRNVEAQIRDHQQQIMLELNPERQLLPLPKI